MIRWLKKRGRISDFMWPVTYTVFSQRIISARHWKGMLYVLESQLNYEIWTFMLNWEISNSNTTVRVTLLQFNVAHVFACISLRWLLFDIWSTNSLAVSYKFCLDWIRIGLANLSSSWRIIIVDPSLNLWFLTLV